MMRLHNKYVWVIVALLWNAVPLRSQSNSPYKLSWDTDPFICVPGAALALGGYIKEHSVSPLTMQEISTLRRSSVNSFDRGAVDHYSEHASTFSDGAYGLAAIAPALFFIDEKMKHDSKTLTVMYLETMEWAGASTLIAKSTIGRIRPFVYNSSVPINEKLSRESRESFFSTHSTVAFASAVFISTVYSEYHPDSEWRPYVWAGTLVSATALSYLRYTAGQHYPSDIVTGAVMGSVIGYLIPWMHQSQHENMQVGIDWSNRLPQINIAVRL